MSHFKCPYCNHDQTITDTQWDLRINRITVKNKRYGEVGLKVSAVSCANPECQEIWIKSYFDKIKYNGGSGTWSSVETIEEFQLRPRSRARPQPEFIPEPLRKDYYEACAIEALSPKASATLARRCLQGMIRDFCKISEKTLFAEIAALKKQVAAGTAAQGVTEDTLAAIDAVRSIGNIGAHMEADINVIVDIDPGEAQALIELIELLFEDWYIAREARAQRLARVQGIAAEKKKQLAAPPQSQQLLAAPAEDDESA